MDKDNAFSFTSEEIKNNIKNNNVLFGIVLLYENNQIIPMEYEGIRCVINNWRIL